MVIIIDDFKYQVNAMMKSPNKNRFSHIHDALQYLLLGAGEGRSLTIGTKYSKPIIAKRNFDVFSGKPRDIYERRR